MENPRPGSYDVVACSTSLYTPILKPLDVNSAQPPFLSLTLDEAPSSSTVHRIEPPPGVRVCLNKNGRVEGACQVIRLYHLPTGCFLSYILTDRQGQFSVPPSEASEPQYGWKPSNGYGASNGLVDPKMCQDGQLPADKPLPRCGS
jgi:hypothetical protein